jgi:hypothetical protein
MLDRKQWLMLVSAAIWVAVSTWVVTGSLFRRLFSRFELLQKIGEPLNALILLAPLVLVGILAAGRLMRLQNWKQWALLSVIALFHVWLWIVFLSDAGRQVAPTFEQFMKERREAPRIPADEVLAFAGVLGVSLGAGGFLIGLLSPPGLWQRVRTHLSTPQHKQLVALLAAAMWISTAVLSYHCSRSSDIWGDCDRRELVRVVGLSLPAVLFGGIAFWWFGRAQR